MDEQRSQSRPAYFAWLIHSLILLVGLVTGAALIYSLQPPKPPPASLLYRVDFFTFAEPRNHFSAPRAALQLATPAGTMWSGADFFGNHQFSTQPQEIFRFTMATPTYLKEFSNFAPLRFEVSGAPHGDRVRAHLKLGVNNTDFSHHFDLDDSEGRLFQFVYGEEPYRRWCYAIIRVTPIQPLPSVGTMPSGPKRK
jgi:hypothetical protein